MARLGRVAVGARDLFVRTARDAFRDRIVEVSAEVAFFALLSLAPGLLVLAGAAGFVADLIGPGVRETMQAQVTTALGSFLSPETTDTLIRPAVEAMFAQGQGGLISIGGLVAVWSASRMMNVFIQAMNIAYDIEEWRSTWRRRLLAVGLTVGGLAAIAVFVPILIAGPRLGALVAGLVGIEGADVAALWRVLYWPITATVGVALLATLYHVAPNWNTPWRRDLPGALFAVALWVAAAFGLRLYVATSVDAGSFGPLAAPVVLVLWLYVSAFAVIGGAELNAAIEKMWPSADSGPKEEHPTGRGRESWFARRRRERRERADGRREPRDDERRAIGGGPGSDVE